MSSNYPDGCKGPPEPPELKDCDECEGFGYYLNSRRSCKACEGTGQIEPDPPEKDFKNEPRD